MSKTPKSVQLCEHCGVKPGAMNKIHGIRLCKVCLNEPEYVMICKSLAKKKYHLTDKDIASIEYIRVDNPHYKCAAKMMLYHECDIKECAQNKVLNQYK